MPIRPEEKKLWAIWDAMKERCTRQTNPRYATTGGRGIRVEGWGSFREFVNWSRAHGYLEGMTLRRRDVADHYSPDTCTWMTREEGDKLNRPPRLLSRRARFVIDQKVSEAKHLYDTSVEDHDVIGAMRAEAMIDAYRELLTIDA